MRNSLRKNFELAKMKRGETIDDHSRRINSIANKIRSNGEEMKDKLIVKKILRTLIDQFIYVVVSIELSVDEIQGTLRHFQYECPKWNKEINYTAAEEEDDLLSMIEIDAKLEWEDVNVNEPTVNVNEPATNEEINPAVEAHNNEDHQGEPDNDQHNDASSEEDTKQGIDALPRRRTWRTLRWMNDYVDRQNLSDDEVDLVQGCKKIGMKWIYKTKKDENGRGIKHKTRFVANGYVQKEGIYYTDVFASVAMMDILLGWSLALLLNKAIRVFSGKNPNFFIQQNENSESDGSRQSDGSSNSDDMVDTENEVNEMDLDDVIGGETASDMPTSSNDTLRRGYDLPRQKKESFKEWYTVGAEINEAVHKLFLEHLESSYNTFVAMMKKGALRHAKVIVASPRLIEHPPPFLNNRLEVWKGWVNYWCVEK
ncbi:hypothetical protein LIER_15647 [Lithospermum erythrorhizon]|uniref:Reverse transcriptase Ty1/copia-type domain-containing protein n=1 Tax=Lithospermum erythrorhizon TaxID=34254 RepID=A0AAV3Q7S1_LITER